MFAVFKSSMMSLSRRERRDLFLIVGTLFMFLFRSEWIKFYGYAQIYHEMCYPEKYPGTCPGLADLAKMQYSRFEAAIISTMTWIVDVNRIGYVTLLGLALFAGVTALKRKKVTPDYDFD